MAHNMLRTTCVILFISFNVEFIRSYEFHISQPSLELQMCTSKTIHTMRINHLFEFIFIQVSNMQWSNQLFLVLGCNSLLKTYFIILNIALLCWLGVAHYIARNNERKCLILLYFISTPIIWNIYVHIIQFFIKYMLLFLFYILILYQFFNHIYP